MSTLGNRANDPDPYPIPFETAEWSGLQVRLGAMSKNKLISGGLGCCFPCRCAASCVLVEDGKSNTTSRNHELSQCETVTKREFLRAQFGIVVCCCWSYIFGLVFPGFQIVPDILVTTSTTSPTTAIFTTDMYPCQLRRIPGAPVLLSVNDVDNRIEQRKNTHTH